MGCLPPWEILLFKANSPRSSSGSVGSGGRQALNANPKASFRILDSLLLWWNLFQLLTPGSQPSLHLRFFPHAECRFSQRSVALLSNRVSFCPTPFFFFCRNPLFRSVRTNALFLVPAPFNECPSLFRDAATPVISPDPAFLLQTIPSRGSISFSFSLRVGPPFQGFAATERSIGQSV